VRVTPFCDLPGMAAEPAEQASPRAPARHPRRALALAAASLALCACPLAQGCGSSSERNTKSGEETAGTTSTGNKPRTSESGTQAGGSSLKAIGKPQYARPSSSEPVLAGTAQIAYRNITVRPNTMRVKAGTTIRWTNYDEVRHNVTSQGGPQRFASKDFGPGGYFQIKLTRPGLVLFKCTIHPATMNGAIEVVR
jgi:plastocyanin